MNMKSLKLMMKGAISVSTLGLAAYQLNRMKTVSMMPRVLPTGEKPYVKMMSAEEKKEICREFPQLFVLPNRAVNMLMSRIRDEKTSLAEFRRFSNRLFRLLLEEALSIQEQETTISESPVAKYDDTHRIQPQLAAVTVLRAGNAFLDEAMKIVPNISVGKILIQRDEHNPDINHFYYKKLQPNISGKKVLVLDPMLASGGTMIKTLSIITEFVPQEDITVVTLITCRQGLKKLFEKYPKIRLVTAEVDPVLDSSGYLLPGVGDFGDRYYGTI